MLAFIACSASAQIFTTVIDETALQFRVKQIDEFFTRFNYETDYKGDKPKVPSDREEHRKNLLTLVNIDKFKNKEGKMDSTLTRFVDFVINKNIKINYQDSTWSAEAIGSLMYEGKKYDAVFRLKTERVKNVIYKWVITGIETSLFKQFPIEPKNTITVSPADHGIGFMTLPETLNLNKSAVGTTFAKGYKRNHLAVFDFLMASGKIKMNTITKVLFHFHLKDVDFDVERIEKNQNYNQGWIINSINFKTLNQNEK